MQKKPSRSCSLFLGLPGFSCLLVTVFTEDAGFSESGSGPAGCRHGDELVFAVGVAVVEEFLDGLGSGFDELGTVFLVCAKQVGERAVNRRA